MFYVVQGDFFNWDSPENVSRLAPPKFAWTGPPPNFSKCWNHIHFARHLGVFRSEGGPVWVSNVFLKSVTYRPTLSKFRGGPVKKITLYNGRNDCKEPSICYIIQISTDGNKSVSVPG